MAIIHTSIVFNIIKTPSNPIIILGISWLERYNPSVGWKLRKVRFPIELFSIEFPKNLKSLNLCLLKQELLWKLRNKVHHPQFMQLQVLNKLLQPQRFRSSTKNLKMYLKRRILTSCRNIIHRIVLLIFKKGFNHHLVQFTIYRRTSF